MRRLASFVAVLILLTTAVAPVLACVTGGSMNRDESACCRSMHGQCGEMAKMGCCRTEVRTDETPQIATVSPATEVQWVVVAQQVPQSSATQHTSAAKLQTPEDYLLPGLLTAQSTVLRI